MSSLPAKMSLIDSKMKELECSQDFSHFKSIGIFPDAQGQLTPQSLVRSSRISNSSEIIWLLSLPASMKKIRSKMKALKGGGVAQWLGRQISDQGVPRAPAGAHFVVALSKSHLPCLVLVDSRKRWTDDRLGQTVTRLEITLCLMC